jgi:hypothetical protein
MVRLEELEQQRVQQQQQQQAHIPYQNRTIAPATQYSYSFSMQNAFNFTVQHIFTFPSQPPLTSFNPRKQRSYHRVSLASSSSCSKRRQRARRNMKRMSPPPLQSLQTQLRLQGQVRASSVRSLNYCNFMRRNSEYCGEIAVGKAADKEVMAQYNGQCHC